MSESDREPRYARPVFLASLAMGLALVAAAAFFPRVQLWGIHHLAYYSPSIRIAALVLAALTFAPPIARVVYDSFVRLGSSVTGRAAGRRAAAAAIVLACLTVFMGFSSTTHLLGDGQLQAKLIQRLSTSPDVDYPYLFRFSFGASPAPGTSLVGLAGTRALSSVTSWHPILIWRIFTAILGVSFVLLLLGFARNARYPADYRVVVFSTALVSGASQLFFGYVETYAFMIVLVTWYFIASFRAIHAKAGVIQPAALLFFASLCHVQALLLLPSLALLVLWRLLSRRSPRSLRAATVGVLAVTASGTIALALLPKTARFFLPLFGREGVHGVISGAHWLDIFNELSLVIPMSPFLVAMGLLVLSRRRPDAAGERTGSSTPGKSKAPRAASPSAIETAFAFVVLVPAAFFLLFFFPELGMARDWDLFILPAAAFMIPAFVLAKRFFRLPGSTECARRYLVPGLAVAAVIVIPWIGINASEQRSVKRYQDIIEMDATNPGYGLEILAMYYGDRGREDLKAEAYQKAYDISRNPRYLVAACSARLKTGDFESATNTLAEYLAKNPEHKLAREVYVEALVRQSRIDEIIDVCRKGIEIHPDDPYFHLYLGIGYFTKGSLTEATEAFDACRRLNPPKIFLDTIDQVMKSLPPRLPGPADAGSDGE